MSVFEINTLYGSWNNPKYPNFSVLYKSYGVGVMETIIYFPFDITLKTEYNNKHLNFKPKIIKCSCFSYKVILKFKKEFIMICLYNTVMIYYDVDASLFLLTLSSINGETGTFINELASQTIIWTIIVENGYFVGIYMHYNYNGIKPKHQHFTILYKSYEVSAVDMIIYLLF